MSPSGPVSVMSIVPRERIVFIDAARGILMLAGVLLHAANIYCLNHEWLIREPGGSTFYDGIIDSIHFFRMQAFFLLSGYFSGMMLAKYGPLGLLNRRLMRITLPLLSTTLTFNLVQDCILDIRAGKASSPIEWLLNPDSHDFYLCGESIGHLWFLIFLAIHILVVAIVAASPASRIFGYVADKVTGLIASLPKVGPVLVVISMPILLILGIGMGHYIPGFYVGNLSIYKLVKYFHYFLFGMLCFRVPALFDAFTSFRPVGLSLLGLAAYGMYLLQLPALPNFMTHLKDDYAHDLLVWLVIWPVLALSRALINRPSAGWTYLADAALSIYLFHHLFVIIAGLVLMHVDMPIALKYIIVVMFSSLAALGIHHYIIRRYALAHLLFNGYRRRV